VKDKYDKLIAEGLTPIPTLGHAGRRRQGRDRHRAGFVAVQHGEVINVDGGVSLAAVVKPNVA